MNETPRKNHPDLHKINDWPLYGPQDNRIEHMVRELTLDYGLRLAEVEELMFEALQVRKSRFKSGAGV